MYYCVTIGTSWYGPRSRDLGTRLESVDVLFEECSASTGAFPRKPVVMTI